MTALRRLASPSARVLMGCALLIAAAEFGAPQPAAAQIGGRFRDRPAVSHATSILAHRVRGDWQSEHAEVRIASNVVFARPQSGRDVIRVHATLNVPRTGAQGKVVLVGDLELNRERTAFQGDWEDTTSYSPDGVRLQGGHWTVHIAGSDLILNGWLGGRTLGEQALVRVGQSAPNPKFTPWLGEWTVQDGVLTFRQENEALVGVVRSRRPNGLDAVTRTVAFYGQTGSEQALGDVMVGTWESTGDPPRSGQVTMSLLAGGNAFGGALEGDSFVWRGQRRQAAPPPQQVEQQQPQAIPPQLAARFAGEWRVGLSYLRDPAPLMIQPSGARFTLPGGFGDHQVTLKPSADLMGLEGAITNFAQTPGVKPLRLRLSGNGGTITAYRIDDNGLEHEVLFTGGRAGGAQPNSPPGQSPAPPVVTPPAPPASAAGFKNLRKFDVRLDRVVAARDAQRIDVFMTLKNATPQQLYVTSGVLQVLLEDTEGVGKQNGQVLRPTEAGREQFASTPVLQPGRELKVKYSFHPDGGTRPARVTVTEGDKSADFPAGL